MPKHFELSFTIRIFEESIFNIMHISYTELKKAAEMIDTYQFCIYNKQLSTPQEPIKIDKPKYSQLSKQKKIKVLTRSDNI